MSQPAINTMDVNNVTATNHYISRKLSDGTVVSETTGTQSGHSESIWHYRAKATGVPVVNGWRAPTSWEHGRAFFGCSGAFLARWKTPLDSVESSRSPIIGFNIPTTALAVRSRFGTVPSALVKEADMKALNNIKDQNIDLGEFLGEFNQTVSLIVNTTNDIRKDVFSFKRKYPREWKKLKGARSLRRCDKCLKKVADKWLELVYGWQPLLSDVFGALDELQRASRSIGMVARVRGKAEDSDSVPFTENIGVQGCISVWALTRERDLTAKTVLWYKLKNPTLAELSSLGLINPMLIAWNLTRYSFVADWFLPIGPWLESLTGDVGWQFLAGTRSTKIAIGEKVEGFLSSNQSGLSYITKPQISVSGEWYKRTVLRTPPVPGFYLKNPLSAKRAVTSIALLVQAFRS